MYIDHRFIYSTIRETVPAIDVCNVLGLKVNGHGRCPCPFHNGRDMNMRVYPGNRGFYCFVCHKGGDCISLAQGLLSEKCTYDDAARWIDKTFNLNLFPDKIPSVYTRGRTLQRKKHGDQE